MKAIWTTEKSRWRLSIDMEEHDVEEGPGQAGTPVGLSARSAIVELPQWVAEPHPDAEALAALVIVRPWVGRRLQVRRGVSSEFAARVQQMFGFEVTPVDDALAPRAPGRTPVISYSAGFDSTAVSAILPEAPHLHHLRVDHPDRPTQPKYQALAIARLAAAASAHGRDVRIIRADFEHLVSPYPSLPHWFGFGVGALLMSHHLDLGAIALGGTLETWYMDMGRKWTGEPALGAGIDPLPALVGLPIMRPTVGLTEVGTMNLTIDSELHGLARSCVGGTSAAPCGLCAKCIRKDLLASVKTGVLMGQLPNLTPGTAGWQAIADAPRPIYMQAQIEYALPRLQQTTPLLTSLRDSLAPDPSETNWMERAYRPAINPFVPAQWRAEVESRIGDLVGFVDEDDVRAMTRWDRTSA